MRQLKSRDLKTLRKMDESLTDLIKTELNTTEPDIFLEAVHQLLENVHELNDFFTIHLNPKLEVYAASSKPVPRPLVSWASRTQTKPKKHQ